MRVIGVASQAQHGKDTLADRLGIQLNKDYSEKIFDCFLLGGKQPLEWQRAAFAANVKKVFKDTFNVDDAFIEEWKVKTEIPPGFDMPVRQALQFIGDGFRKIQGTIWLDLAFRDTEPKIISDVRYINEFTRVKAEGGLNILIGRPDKLNDDPNGSEAQIRPYVDWCLNSYAPEMKFIDLHKYRIPTVLKLKDDGTLVYPLPEHMESFDVFIRNDGTIDDLYKIVDEQLVPYVEAFQFK